MIIWWIAAKYNIREKRMGFTISVYKVRSVCSPEWPFCLEFLLFCTARPSTYRLCICRAVHLIFSAVLFCPLSTLYLLLKCLSSCSYLTNYRTILCLTEWNLWSSDSTMRDMWHYPDLTKASLVLQLSVQASSVHSWMWWETCHILFFDRREEWGNNWDCFLLLWPL